jgi:hypothetical protein
VILTWFEGDYHIGDELTAQAHIFRDGERFDPDTIRFTAGKDYSRVAMRRLARGLWEGTIRIMEEQIYNHDNYPIEVQVTADTPEHEWDFDSHLVWVRGIPHLHVDLSINDDKDLLAAPGDDVEFTVTVSHGDQFVDPDYESLNVWAEKGYDIFYDSLRVSRRSTGVYDGVFTVPSEISQEIVFRLRAKANYTGDIDTESDGSIERIYIRKYATWVHHIAYDSSKAYVDFMVHDIDGTPVANAPIDLNWTFWDKDDNVSTIELSTMTGSEGIAPLEIPMDVLGNKSDYNFADGQIEMNGFVQRVSLWIPNLDFVYYRDKSNDGFRVNLLGNQPIPAGSQAELHFYATYNGEPLSNTNIVGYVYWDHSILFNGTRTTDVDGGYVIELETPGKVHEGSWRDSLTGQFKAMTSAGLNSSWRTYEFSHWGSYGEYRSWKFSDTILDLIQIDGWTYRFSLMSPGLDGKEEKIRVTWDLGEHDTYDWAFPGWESGDLYFFSDHPASASWSGDRYEGVIQIPPFIPGDITFNLVATIKLMDEPHSETRTVIIGNSTEYLNNEPPIVEIDLPIQGGTVEGRFSIKGTASDDSAIEAVEVRIDGGPWTLVTGTDDWELEIMASALTDGMHSVEARSFDGIKRSDIDTVEFNYMRVEHQTMVSWSNLVIIMVVILMLVTIVVIVRTRSVKS